LSKGAAAHNLHSRKNFRASDRNVNDTFWKETAMAWTTPEISEVCVGMEVTSYASAEI